MSGLFRTGDIDENFLKFLYFQDFYMGKNRRATAFRTLSWLRNCPINDQWFVCFQPIFLGGFKKQLNRYSGRILKYVMDIQGAARLDFVMS